MHVRPCVVIHCHKTGFLRLCNRRRQVEGCAVCVACGCGASYSMSYYCDVMPMCCAKCPQKASNQCDVLLTTECTFWHNTMTSGCSMLSSTATALPPQAVDHCSPAKVKLSLMAALPLQQVPKCPGSVQAAADFSVVRFQWFCEQYAGGYLSCLLAELLCNVCGEGAGGGA